MMFLAACSTGKCSVPPWPVAGKSVAEELHTLPADQFPNLWNWLGRLKRFKEQLDVAGE